MPETPKTISGWAALVTGATLAAPAALAGGLISKARGKSFVKGIGESSEAIHEKCIDPFIRFADKHNDTVMKTVVAGIVAAGTKSAVDAVKGGSRKS